MKKHYLFSIWCKELNGSEDVCVMDFDDGDSLAEVFRIADSLDDLGIQDVSIHFETFSTEE